MTDVIGQSVIKVVADATDLKAGMAQARAAVEAFEKTAATSGAAAANSLTLGVRNAAAQAERAAAAAQATQAGAQKAAAASAAAAQKAAAATTAAEGKAAAASESSATRKVQAAERAAARQAAAAQRAADAAERAAVRQAAAAERAQEKAVLAATRAAERAARAQERLVAAEQRRQAREARETARGARGVDAESRRFVAALEREAMAAGRTRSQVLELRAAKLGLTNQSAPLIARIRQSEQVIGNMGLSVKQTAAAMRLLPAQLTDIVTSIASGMPIWLVAIQQGGQLKDSFGGLGATMRALSTVFTPARVAIGAVGAAAGVTAWLFKQAQDEADSLMRALTMTGRAAGYNADQFQAMAQRIATAVGTQRDAMLAISELVAGGRLTGESLEAVAQAAVNLERDASVPLEETRRLFEELYRDPLDASVKLNETNHYLTLGIIEQIRALQEQGRHQEAGALAVKTYADVVNQRTPEVEKNLNAITRGWRATKDAVTGAIDSVRDFFRTASGTADLDLLKRFRGDRELGGGYDSRPLVAMHQRQNDERERALQLAQDQTATEAKSAAETAANQQAAIRAAGEIAKLREQTLTKEQQMAKALREYRQHLDAIRKADPTSARLDPKEIASIEANIREKFKERGEKGRKSEAERYLDSLQKQLVSLRGTTAVEEAILTIERLRKEEGIKISKELEKQIIAAAKRNDQYKDERAMLDLIAQAEQRHTDRLTDEARQWENAKVAAQEYLDTLRRGFDRELGAMGLGRRAAEIAAGRNQIEDRYAQQILQRESDQRLNPVDEKRYQRELGLIRSSREEALRIYDDYYERRRQQEDSFNLGIQGAVADYLDESNNHFQLAGDAAIGIFGGMENAVVNFARTGKFEIKQLADVVVAELSRIAAKKIIAGIVGNIFGVPAGGNFGAAPGEAVPFATGTNYVPYDGFRAILHKGEAVVPKEYNPAAGGHPPGGGNVTVQINVNGVKDEGGLRRSSTQIAAAAARGVRQAQRVS